MIERTDLLMLKAEIAKRSFIKFVEMFWHLVDGRPFQKSWVVEAICDHIVGVGKYYNGLIISVCPSSGKSKLVSVLFPAWNWLHNPGETYLYSSYNFALAERHSVECRSLIESELYQACYPEVQLRKNSKHKLKFSNTKNGERFVTSMGGGTTGQHCSMAIIDDPHEMAESQSLAKREARISWVANTWMSRLIPGGRGRVVVGHRVARDDVIGHLLDNYPNEFCHLCLPYEYRSSAVVESQLPNWKDPRTKEGEILWPGFFRDKEIQSLKKKIRSFNAAYNQSPVLSGPDAFFQPEYINTYTEAVDGYLVDGQKFLKSDCYCAASADLSEGKVDYSCVVISDVHKSGTMFVKHVIRERLKPTFIVPWVKHINEEYNPEYILVEANAGYKFIVQQMKDVGLPVKGFKPIESKLNRAIPLQFKLESGKLFFAKNATWLPFIESEMLEFPEGPSDDFVDACASLTTDVNRRTRFYKNDKEAGEGGKTTKTKEQIFAEALTSGL